MRQKKMTQFLGRSTALFGLCLLICNCAPKLYINESYRQAFTVPVVEGTISLERGETIEVRDILKLENVTPEKILITRLTGNYVLTAEGFKSLWLLRPVGGERASYYKLDLPIKDPPPLRNPRFEHSVSHQCVVLNMEIADGEQQWYIHTSGKIARKCEDVSDK
jgi:hypothetical protein